MKKYKVNYDRKQPSSEEINARKNFDGLMNQLPATPVKPLHKPFWKTGWFTGGLAAAAAVAITLTVYLNKGETNDGQNPKGGIVTNGTNGSTTREPGTGNSVQASKACIAPPIAGLNIPYTNYKVKADKGAQINYSSGSKVTIPAGAFVDEKGNPVKGEVDVRYRELHDPVDFFLSGIPMAYDSAGQKYHFESAGMVDIAAFKDGKVVYMKPDKKMEIQLASKDASSKYNLYYLDTASHNWDYLGKDQVKQVKVDDPAAAMEQQLASKKQETDNAVQQISAELDQKIAAIDQKIPVPAQPEQPKKADKGKNRFNVDLDMADFPEMKAYKGVVWEVDESREKFDRGIYDIDWEDIALAKGEKKDAYVCTLKKGLRTVKIDIYPVFDTKDYATAMEVFNEKFAQYNTALNNRKAEEERLKKEYDQLMADQRLAYQKYQERLKKEMEAMAISEKTYRVFTVSGFGVYNCDSPMMYPSGASILATFTDNTGKQLACRTNIYLVDKAKNGMFTYYANPEKAFRFNPAAQNLIWTVVDGKLYTIMPADFKKLGASGTQQVALSPVDKEFRDPEEMKAYFGI